VVVQRPQDSPRLASPGEQRRVVAPGT
jgi:hypothetical protein